MPGRNDAAVPLSGDTNLASAPPGAGRIDTDVIVVGAGAVGLTLGIALARAGVDVAVVGLVATRMPGRTVALLEGSIRFLETLGLWPDLARWSAPLRTMRLVDDTGSLFRIPPVNFRAQEIGKPWFGCNIENWQLLEGLASAARNRLGLTLIEQHLDGFEFSSSGAAARLEDGRHVRAPVLVAADGRRSPARAAAGLPVRTWRYPQAALTAILRHEHGHDDVSTEFHTRQGPFTLVPLPGLPDAPHRSSMVWVMLPGDASRRSALDPPQLARAIERQSRMLLGRVALEGPCGSFPISGMVSDRMAGPRIALAGEAAHAFPPIGAQGLNLGLRDVALLAQLLADAKGRDVDLGSPAILGRYARARRGDVALRTMAVDWLNRALLADFLPVDFVRGAGLLALSSFGPLRRLAMREGLMPQGLAPNGMRKA